jgi:hypothetical protein
VPKKPKAETLTHPLRILRLLIGSTDRPMSQNRFSAISGIPLDTLRSAENRRRPLTLQMLDLIRINAGAQWSSSRNKWLVAFSRAEDKEEFSLAYLIAYRSALKEGHWNEPVAKNMDLYALCRRLIGLLKSVDQDDFQETFMKLYTYIEACWVEAGKAGEPAKVNGPYRDTELYLRVAKDPKTGEIRSVQKRYPFMDAGEPPRQLPRLDFRELEFRTPLRPRLPNALSD